jgi:hypothetical protein
MHSRSPGSISQIPDLESEHFPYPVRPLGSSLPGPREIAEREDEERFQEALAQERARQEGRAERSSISSLSSSRGTWSIPQSQSQSLSQSLHEGGRERSAIGTGIAMGMRLEPLSFDARTMSSFTNERNRADSSASPISPGGSQSIPRLLGYLGDTQNQRPGTGTGSDRAFPSVLRPGSGSTSSSSMPMSAGLGGSFTGMTMQQTQQGQQMDVLGYHQQQGEAGRYQREQQGTAQRYAELTSPYHTGRSRRPDSPSLYPSRPTHGQAPFTSSSSPRYGAHHLPPILPPLQGTSNTHANPSSGYPQRYNEPGPSSLPDRLGQPSLEHPHHHQPQFPQTPQREQFGDPSGISVFGNPEYTSVIPSASRKRLTGKSNTPAACSACKK